MAITTSIVINFQDPEAADAANAVLSAEIDSREDGLNSGDTQFTYGDAPAFLVFRTDNVSYTMEATDGSIAEEVGGTIDMDEIIIFVDETETRLSKPPTGAVTFTVLAGRGISSPTDLTISGTVVSNPEKALAVVRAQYVTTYEAYRLSGVVRPAVEGLEEYAVVIYLLGEVAP